MKNDLDKIAGLALGDDAAQLNKFFCQIEHNRGIIKHRSNLFNIPQFDFRGNFTSCCPVRIKPLSARAPSNSEIVLNSTDLPASVSPVITLKPEPNSTSVASIKAKFLILIQTFLSHLYKNSLPFQNLLVILSLFNLATT